MASDLAQRVAVGDRELGRGGRRRRARIGREIRERQIDLVTDRADHRHRAARDRAHDALVVERGEIGHRAAAAPDDHARRRRRARPSPCPLTIWFGALGALHRRVGDQDRRRQPALHRADDVVDRGAVLRRHHADPAREPRQRPLLLGREHALGRELLLELLERERLGAEPRGLREVGVELHLAVAVVDAEPAAHAQALARLDLGTACRVEVAAPHHRRQAPRRDRAARSRDVRSAGLRHLRHLALEPQQAQPVERCGPPAARRRRRRSGRSRLRTGGPETGTANGNQWPSSSQPRGWRGVVMDGRMPTASVMAEQLSQSPTSPARRSRRTRSIRTRSGCGANRPKIGVDHRGRAGVPVRLLPAAPQPRSPVRRRRRRAATASRSRTCCRRQRRARSLRHARGRRAADVRTRSARTTAKGSLGLRVVPDARHRRASCGS